MDARMTYFIENPHRYLKDVGRGSKEPHVLKTRYNALLPISIDNLQAEFINALRPELSADGSRSLQLDAELELKDEYTADKSLDSGAREGSSQLRCIINHPNCTKLKSNGTPSSNIFSHNSVGWAHDQ